MNGQDQLWLAFLKHLKTRQPKNGVLWKEIGQQQAGCTYCDETGGGALICCSSSDCRVRAHLTCAQVRGSLRLNTDNVLLYSCDKHTEPIHFCTCKSLHDDQSAMTACDSCEEWFHNSCVGLSDSEPIDNFVCKVCVDLKAKANSPQHKEAAIKAIEARKKKNQAKERLNALREEAFQKLDPFTDTLYVDIAPIINVISTEEYRFQDPEIAISHVETAVSRLEKEILSATPGKVDYSDLPANADVLRTFRRNPLVFKWRDDLMAVRDAYNKWKKSGEGVVREMCEDLVEKIEFTKEHGNALRGYYERMKPIKKRLATLRCSENDSAWFVALMECMVWLVELYRYVQDKTSTLAADRSDDSNLSRFQGHLKKLKNCRNNLQAAVVNEEVASTVSFFSSVLEAYGHLANREVDRMLEWNRQVHKVCIASTSDVTLDHALDLQREGEGFSLVLPGLSEINNRIAEARQFEKQAESFLATSSASPDLQYHENSGLVGIDLGKLDELSSTAESVHLHTPAKVHMNKVVQCIELLSEWADVMNARGDGNGVAGKSDDDSGRVQVSSLHDFLDNDLAGDQESDPDLLKRLRGWRELVMGRAKEMLDSARPYITKAHKCLGKLTLENVSGVDKTLQEMQKFRVICEEESILVFMQQAHSLALSAREALEQVKKHAGTYSGEGSIDLETFNDSKNSLFPIENLQKLQMNMNKALKNGPSGFIRDYKRAHGKQTEAWVGVVETLVDSFLTLTNDIANVLSEAAASWNQLAESLQLSADGARFLPREQLLTELARARGTGTLNDAVAIKAITAVKAGSNQEGVVNEGLLLESIEDTNAVASLLERLHTECLFLPVSEALHARVCRHLSIAKALTVTESLEQALNSGANLVGAIAVFKDLILDSEAGSAAGSSGPNEVNMRLFDEQKLALETLEADGADASDSEVDKYLLERAFRGKFQGATKTAGGAPAPTSSLPERFTRLWWIAEAKYLLDEHGDMAQATKLMGLAKTIKNLDDQDSYIDLQAAIKNMVDFEHRVFRALGSLEAASKASDDALEGAPSVGEGDSKAGKNADEEKLNVFAAAIKKWKDKLGSTSEDIENLLKELRRSQNDTESQESAMDVSEGGSQEPTSSQGNNVVILKNTSIERELSSASKLCKFVRDGSKTYIDVMQAMLIEEGPAGAGEGEKSGTALVPASHRLQLSIQASAVVELRQLERFIDSFRKLHDSLQGQDTPLRGIGRLRLVTFLLELLSFYSQKAQRWLEAATSMVPVVATRFKSQKNFTNNVKATDLERCLKQPVARAVITDVHNTILKVLSDYESFNFKVKHYLVPGLVSQPEYAEYRAITDTDGANGEQDAADSSVFDAVKSSMAGEADSGASHAIELEQARQALLLRRKQRAEGLIDEGNRLSLDTRNEVAALQWAIKVIFWDREAGATAPGKETSVNQYYSLEKAEERERKMRGILSQQSIDTAKTLVELGVMREEQKEDGKIAAVYNSDRIHPTILASIDQLQAIGKGVQAINSSGIPAKIQVHIATINNENLSVTSEKFVGIKKSIRELFEESISVGECSTPQITICEVPVPPRRIVVGLPDQLRKQTDHILSDKFRDRTSLGKAGSSKGLRGARGLSQDDDSSASDSDSSSDDDDGEAVDEAAVRGSKRTRTPSEKQRASAAGAKAASKGVARVSKQAQEAAAAAARQERERIVAANSIRRPPCAGFLCNKKRALESSRYCSWSCATDAAQKLLPLMQKHRQCLLSVGGPGSRGQGGTGIGSPDGTKADKHNKAIVNSTTAADRTAFQPTTLDGQSVAQEMDECVKSHLGPFGVLLAGPTGVVEGDTDSEAPSEGTSGASYDDSPKRAYSEGDVALEKLLGSLAGSSSEQVDAPPSSNGDASSTVAGSAILPSLPSAARNIVNPPLRADSSRMSTSTAEFLLLGNSDKFKDPYEGVKNTRASERRVRTQYRLRLEASLAQALERIRRVNYAGTAAALALELEDALNDSFLEPFEHQETFHSQAARAMHHNERKKMLGAYGEKYQILRKAFREPHNDDKVRQWLSGAIDADDIAIMQPSEFESAEAEKERERIRNERMKAALREDDKDASSGAASDALTAVSQSEIAASAKRKRQQEEEEELRRRRKAGRENAKQGLDEDDDGTNAGISDGADEDMDVEPADPSVASRKRKANVDIGTSYAKQLKPAGTTVVNYTPGVGSEMRREGVGYIKTEKDLLPYDDGANAGSSSVPAAVDAGEKGKKSEVKVKAEAPIAKPAPAGKMLKKGKGILGIIKAAPSVADAPEDAAAHSAGADSGIEDSAAAPLYLLSNKGNAALTVQRAGAAPMSCFGMVASHDRGVQGVLDDHLHMEGRTKPSALNFYLDKYQKERSKNVAPILLTVGGDLTQDSSYANMVRELTDAGKERAALMVPEGYKKAAKSNNYEVYLIPPPIKHLFPAITSREEEFARLRVSAGSHCTDDNSFYGLVTYVESGLQHYCDASEVVMNHAANAAKSVIASITSDVLFEPEEAASRGKGDSGSPSALEGEVSGGGSSVRGGTAESKVAYASATAAFSASYATATDNGDGLDDTAYLVNKAAINRDAEEEVSFDPAPAQPGIPNTINTASSSSSPSGTKVSNSASAAAMDDSGLSAETRELLTKAADHCARNGVNTFKSMQAREKKQKAKTMPFLLPGQPGHELFKAEVVRREKELKKNHH